MIKLEQVDLRLHLQNDPSFGEDRLDQQPILISVSQLLGALLSCQDNLSFIVQKLKVYVHSIVMAQSDEVLQGYAKNTIKEFIEDLRTSIFTGAVEQVALAFVDTYFSQISSEEAMGHLISHVLPHKVQIQNRNVQFFLDEKASIFKGLPEEKIDHFAKLVTTPAKYGGMDDENKEVIWRYFDTFIEIAEIYKKKR
jgi:hypothetical protein